MYAESIRFFINWLLVRQTTHPNMVVAVRKLDVEHLRCLGHTLQLCVLTALKGVKDVIDSAREIAGHFHHSAKQLTRLHAFQKAANAKQRNVPTDSVTRWSSTWRLLNCLVQNRSSIVAVYAEAKQTCPFCCPDWGVASLIVPLLEPIHRATTVLSGSKYATLSL